MSDYEKKDNYNRPKRTDRRDRAEGGYGHSDGYRPRKNFHSEGGYGHGDGEHKFHGHAGDGSGEEYGRKPYSGERHSTRRPVARHAEDNGRENYARSEKPYSERKPYEHKKPYGERKSFGDRKPLRERKPYDGEKKYAEKKPYDEERSYEGPAATPVSEDEFEDSLRESDASIHGNMDSGLVIGRNAVRELLKSGRSIDKLLVQKGQREGSIVVLVAEATERGIPVIETEKGKLDEMAGFVPHQGVIAMAAEKEYCTVEDILKAAEDKGEKPLLVIADGITDPYNLGAIIRCAEGAGAHGVIIPKRRAVGLTPLVGKASAGALEHMPVAKVSNIANTIAMLKGLGIWVYAAEAGGQNYDEIDYTTGCAIVMGSEGDGVSDIVRKTCDGTASIPMYGLVNSFNVSTATAVLLCEASRQRHKK